MEYMSTEISMFASFPPTYQPEFRRQFWGGLFGYAIQKNRQNAGLSVGEAARLSGMEVSEWAAIEDGYVPQETNRLRAMAAALEISYDQLLNLVLLCREAWEL
jgi:transcriptional regulator with XRE-family HTH domain